MPELRIRCAVRWRRFVLCSCASLSPVLVCSGRERRRCEVRESDSAAASRSMETQCSTVLQFAHRAAQRGVHWATADRGARPLLLCAVLLLCCGAVLVGAARLRGRSNSTIISAE